MPLFEVPGWSPTMVPIPEPSTQVSKKRKRPSRANFNGPQSTEVNMERLVEKLKGNTEADDRNRRSRRKSRLSARQSLDKTARKREGNVEAVELKKRTISRPKPLKGTAKPPSSFSPPPAKKLKTKHDETKSSTSNIMQVMQPKDGLASSLTAFQEGMKQSLNGARFRWINETLYKTDSKQAHRMMQDDPSVYDEYHIGFHRQVQSWPINPVQHYISTLATYPPKTVIADFGCGEAAIARALIPQGIVVLSFDLVSDGTYVTETDICGKIPLPGSEGNSETAKSYGEGHVVDVVVCALSLMATNWPNCIREAWRVLKPNGELKIAEVASRFTDLDEFSALVASIGFKLKSKDERNTHFTLFEFRKIPCNGKIVKTWDKVLSRGSILKPCEYKRR